MHQPAEEKVKRSLGPDALRGIACSAVVIHHMAHFLPEITSWPYQFARMFLGLGVPLFFMISAFAMQTAYEGKLSKSSEFSTYFVRRIMRIYPLYFLMLVIFTYFFNPIKSDWHLEKILAHYFFYTSLLFGLIPGLAHGLVWASWSISVEILFYICYPLVANFNAKLILLFGLALSGHAISFALAPTIQPDVIDASWYWAVAWHQYVPFFILGIIIYQLKILCASKEASFQRKMLSISFIISIALSTFLFSYFEWPFQENGKIVPSRFVNLLIASTPALFFLMLFSAIRTPRFLVNRVTIFLGKISYSIYLVHPLIVYLLLPYYTTIQKIWGTSFFSFVICILLTFIILIPLSFLSFTLIENPAMRLGKYLTKSTHIKSLQA